MPSSNKPLPEPMLTQLSPYGITRPQWVKTTLWIDEKQLFNTTRPEQDGCHFYRHFRNHYILISILLNIVPVGLIDNKSALLQVMAWCHQAADHYLNQWWPSSTIPFGITCSQWVNWLWPGDAIWWHRTRSTLAQVMACCLTAPSHYLNQCWLIIGEVRWHSSQGIILRQCEDTNQ